jgi:transcriptional activator SPT7
MCPFHCSNSYIYSFSIPRANPAEPPPPFPPPPPFIPLNSDKVDDQIGLLKPYYQGRINTLMNPAQLPPPPAFGFNPGSYLYAPQGLNNNAPPVPPANSLPIMLPDDPPNPSQVKMGPLGQIIKGGPLGVAAKKKTKRKDPPGLNGDLIAAGPESQPSLSQSSVPGFPLAESPAKKKKGAVVGGAGNKKAKLGEALPPVVVASA